MLIFYSVFLLMREGNKKRGTSILFSLALMCMIITVKCHYHAFEQRYYDSIAPASEDRQGSSYQAEPNGI